LIKEDIKSLEKVLEKKGEAGGGRKASRKKSPWERGFGRREGS